MGSQIAINRLLPVVWALLWSVSAWAAITATGDTSPSNPATWISTTMGYVGKTTEGTVAVTGGSKLMSDSGRLGYEIGSMGAATISGIGSQWNSSTISVGVQGRGILTVEAGGVVTGSSLNIAAAYGGTGDVTVSGAGSQLNNAQGVRIGHRGGGTLNIQAGGVVNSGFSFLGYGSRGEATITGSGSTWNAGDLTFGPFGVGILNIQAGGTVTNHSAELGSQPSSMDEATITGVGSQFNNTSNLIVGEDGHGTLNVQAGGKVTNKNGYLGNDYNSTGEAAIEGANSSWINSGGLYVGNRGIGTMNIRGGASVSSDSSYVGYGSTSTGDVTVSGPGSQWNNSGELIVGFYGEGTLTVTNGGRVNVGGQFVIDVLVDGNSAAGYVNVSTGGMLALASDETGDDSLDEFLELVDGAVGALRYWDSSLSTWADIATASYGLDYTLKYVKTGQLTGYTLLTVGEIPQILAGDYNSDGIVDAADYSVWRDNVGRPAGSLPNDIDGGKIGVAHYNTWKNSYGRTSALGELTASKAVPEPSVGLLGVGVAVLAGLGRRLV